MQKELGNTMKLDEQVYCSMCKGKRNHEIVLTYKRQSEPYDDFNWRVNYHIVKCAGCDNISFVEQHANEDIWEMIDGQRVWGEEFTVFPEEPKTIDPYDPFINFYNLEVNNYRHAPEMLHKLYTQIVESYNDQYHILTTFGLRALIEGICSHQKIKKGFIYDENQNKLPNKEGVIKKNESLGGRIFGLYENGHILFNQALILQEIKSVGDSAIHEIEIPHFVRICEMIKILEKVMYDVFELKNHHYIKRKKKEADKVISNETEGSV